MTRLTIPTAATAQGIAGQNPGRPFRAQPVPASQVGTAMQEFGNVVAQFGQRLEEDRRAHARDRAEIDAAQGMAELRAQVDEIEDPYEAELAWNKGVEDLRGQIAQRAEDQPDNRALRLHQPDLEYVNSKFTRMRQQHDATLAPRFLSERMRAHHAAIEDMGVALSETWLAGNREARSEAESYFVDFLDRQVQRGVLTPEEAETREIAWFDTLQQAEMRRDEDADADPVPEPDPASVLSDRIADDPDLTRLAAARRFVPINPAEVERMAALVERIDTLPEGERAAFIDSQVAEAQQTRRRALPRPTFAPPGDIDAPAIAAAVKRLRSAYQARQVSQAEFIRQAELLQEYQELLNG